jgi:hypothetical protein
MQSAPAAPAGMVAQHQLQQQWPPAAPTHTSVLQPSGGMTQRAAAAASSADGSGCIEFSSDLAGVLPGVGLVVRIRQDEGTGQAAAVQGQQQHGWAGTGSGAGGAKCVSWEMLDRYATAGATTPESLQPGYEQPMRQLGLLGGGASSGAGLRWHNNPLAAATEEAGWSEEAGKSEALRPGLGQSGRQRR